ncbi:hypothetical protein [Streptomyces sp. I05A-00742]|uniref:hypothetical protein n=1 Tax=Streptomyces sp. I05A-00742 TaxID=2732853 RepID=UPI0014884F73|nr:hypothetical protein [Streptomyces sp. I05A-00742]
MAAAHLTAAPCPPAPHMAAPGYGKRFAPDQAPRSRTDFAHLPAREAAIAAYVDRLPEGAAMDVKTLAKSIAGYGQQAVGKALNHLSEAGHLRRFRERVSEERTQWVSRTFFSRTARDDAWWSAFLAEDVPQAPDASTSHPEPTPEPQPEPQPEPEPTPEPEPEPTPAPAPAPEPEEDPAPRPPAVPAPSPARHPRRTAPTRRSPAYEALASVGRTDPRMTLSAAECAALEPLAAEWLARRVSAQEIVRELTRGLPPGVHSPGAFARRRLVDKLPPEPVLEAAPAPVPRRIMECTDCRTPGPPAALPGGLCRVCRGVDPSTHTTPETPEASEDPEAAAAFANLLQDLRSTLRDNRTAARRR